MVNQTTWQLERGRDGQPIERLTNNGASFLAPCRDKTRGCPKGTPEQPNTLSAANTLCYQHYCECRAVGSFPDDSVVRRNAAVIQAVLDSIESQKQVEQHSALLRSMQEP